MYHAGFNANALIYALAQQSESLPAELQISLIEIDRAIAADRYGELEDDLEARKRELIKSHKPLELAYRKELEDWHLNVANKSLSSMRIESIFRGSDWVESARQSLDRLNAEERRYYCSPFLSTGSRKKHSSLASIIKREGWLKCRQSLIDTGMSSATADQRLLAIKSLVEVAIID